MGNKPGIIDPAPKNSGPKLKRPNPKTQDLGQEM